MHKKLQEEKLKLIVDTIQKGVYLAEVKMGSLGLYDKNGLGLFSLNFIFKALREYTNDEFEIVQFKRGPFEMVFLYDAETKTLITFTSQNNAKRLQQRVAIKKAHYNDAFVLYNAGWFEEPQQLCLFSDETETQRQKIYQDIFSSKISPSFFCLISIYHTTILYKSKTNKQRKTLVTGDSHKTVKGAYQCDTLHETNDWGEVVTR